ncbi:MAG TPA: hypothetical protein VH297_12935 [Gaiellaceae bacterium]
MLLAGCGGGGSKQASPSCKREAVSAGEHAGSILVHYSGGTVYPADMSLIGLKGTLDRFDHDGCPNQELGRELKRRLSPHDRETLLPLLPRPTAARIQSALNSVP